MRPPGVRQRVLALLGEHRQRVDADTSKRVRSTTEWFVQLSGRCAFGDVSVFDALEAFRLARHARDGMAGEELVGFGARLLDCLNDVDVTLGGMADGPEDKLLRVFTDVPPGVVLRAFEPDVHFHLVCVTAARSALDGIDTPYLAARAMATMRVLRPEHDYGITATGERLAIRYEDEPAARDEVAAEIRAELAAYLSAVPFDV